MPELKIEFSNDTLVYTDRGVEKLVDLLEKPIESYLWGIKWLHKGLPNGISFHKSHKRAKEFADLQLDSEPQGPARLVDVSAQIYANVECNGFCWTELTSFDAAKEYKGKTWNR